MNRLAGLYKRPEIIAAARHALGWPQFAKDGEKRSSLVFSITSHRIELRFSREHRQVRDGHELGQSSAGGILTGGMGPPGPPSPPEGMDPPGPSSLIRPTATASGLSYEARGFQSGQRTHSASLRKDTGAINFWGALTDVERLDFVELSDEQIFTAGDKLMKEGDQANHVVVISSGRVRVYVQENGQERTLAERGPGDLIGERAALEISVRSATVVALEEVRALVARTEDFATFVSNHPAVLRVIESQIYDRLTEEAVSRVPHAARLLCGQNCTIIVTDVAEFASVTRNDQDRLAIRRVTATMTQEALAPFWDACCWADRGDGLLIVVPPDIPTAMALERLMTVVPAALGQHNRIHPNTMRVQLRVAVNVGPVVTDDMGMSGLAIIRAARMLEAPVFKKAIADAGAPLGVIASEFVYEMAIRHAREPLDPSRYVPVQVDVKECQAPAWMQVLNPD